MVRLTPRNKDDIVFWRDSTYALYEECDMVKPPDTLTIEQAAAVAGVSRRTIERWIKSEKLRAFTADDDRRTRLVLDSDLMRLVAERRRSPMQRAQRHQISSSTGWQPDWDSTIDEVLKIVYSHFHRLHVRFMDNEVHGLSIEELRQGPLGRELAFIARLADGQAKDIPSRVVHLTNEVLSFFFWPPMSPSYVVPRSFWETDFGRMISLARFRAYDKSELVSIGAVASRLDVTRPTLYRWMDEGHLSYVRDELSGKTFLIDQEVTALLDSVRLDETNEEGFGNR